MVRAGFACNPCLLLVHPSLSLRKSALSRNSSSAVASQEDMGREASKRVRASLLATLESLTTALDTCNHSASCSMRYAATTIIAPKTASSIPLCHGLLQPYLDVVRRLVMHSVPPVGLKSCSDGAEGSAASRSRWSRSSLKVSNSPEWRYRAEGAYAAAVEYGIRLGGNGRNSGRVVADFFEVGREGGFGVTGSIFETGENDICRQTRKRVDHRGTTECVNVRLPNVWAAC